LILNREEINLVDLSYEYVDFVIIKRMNCKKIKVFVYTVNNIDDVLRMKSIDVDVIASGYPDAL